MHDRLRDHGSPRSIPNKKLGVYGLRAVGSRLRSHSPIPPSYLGKCSYASPDEAPSLKERTREEIVADGVSMLRQQILGKHNGEPFNPYILEMLAHTDSGAPDFAGKPEEMDERYLFRSEGYEIVRVHVYSEECLPSPSAPHRNGVYRPLIALVAPERGPEEEPLFSEGAINTIAEIEAQFNT